MKQIAATRQDALAQKLTLYHGRLCVKHDSDIRYASIGSCVKCAKENCTERRKPGYVSKGRALLPRKLERRLYAQAKYRAAKRGLEFTIVLADVPPLPEKCPVRGVVFSFGSSKNHDDAATIDRIDARKGYVPGNLVIVSWRVNRLKSNATLAELRQLVDFYSTLAGDPRA